MEGVGDRAFRRAISVIGGFDEACTAFISVPKDAHVKSLAKVYEPDLTAPIPQTAQIMGYDPVLCAAMAQELEARGAPRIDLNCGCPSNTVTGRGAGSSLLQDPDHLHRVASSIVSAVKVPVSVKIRSGYADTSLFEDIIGAVEASGADRLTLHPRTKVEGYGPPARWDLIRRAKELLTIPVVGSGDVREPMHAYQMVEETGCDGVMIGRGAIANPFIFQEIRGPYQPSIGLFKKYLSIFFEGLRKMRPRTQINKLKQLIRFMGYLEPLRSQIQDPEAFFTLIQKGLLTRMTLSGDCNENKSFDYSRPVERGQDRPSPGKAIRYQQERPQPQAEAERPCA